MCFELISLKSLLVGWATLWKLRAQIYIRTEPLYKLKDLN